MARRVDALLLNDAFSVTISLRALISLDAIFRSLAQAGSKPQLGPTLGLGGGFLTWTSFGDHSAG